MQKIRRQRNCTHNAKMKTIGQVSEQTIVYNGYENRVQNAKIHNVKQCNTIFYNFSTSKSRKNIEEKLQTQGNFMRKEHTNIGTKHLSKSISSGLQAQNKPGQRRCIRKSPKSQKFLKQKTSQSIF